MLAPILQEISDYPPLPEVGAFFLPQECHECQTSHERVAKEYHTSTKRVPRILKYYTDAGAPASGPGDKGGLIDADASAPASGPDGKGVVIDADAGAPASMPAPDPAEPWGGRGCQKSLAG